MGSDPLERLSDVLFAAVRVGGPLRSRSLRCVSLGDSIDAVPECKLASAFGAALQMLFAHIGAPAEPDDDDEDERDKAQSQIDVAAAWSAACKHNPNLIVYRETGPNGVIKVAPEARANHRRRELWLRLAPALAFARAAGPGHLRFSIAPFVATEVVNTFLPLLEFGVPYTSDGTQWYRDSYESLTLISPARISKFLTTRFAQAHYSESDPALPIGAAIRSVVPV